MSLLFVLLVVGAVVLFVLNDNSSVVEENEIPVAPVIPVVTKKATKKAKKVATKKTK